VTALARQAQDRQVDTVSLRRCPQRRREQERDDREIGHSAQRQVPKTETGQDEQSPPMTLALSRRR
jgi:hypothetical protein